MQQVEDAIEQLNALGFRYELVDTKRVKTTPSKTKGQRQTKEGGICPICEFATEKFHDGRQHRSQANDKRPFTDDELKERGLTRLD